MNMTVLAFRSSYCEINHRVYEQIFAAARAEGWSLQVIEYGRATGAGQGTVADGLGVNVPKLLDFWKPDGCLVESSMGLWRIDPQDFKSVPTVFFEWNPSDLPGWAHDVYGDGQAVAACAARELMSIGLRHFAFVPYADFVDGKRPNAASETYWSRDRRKAFAHFLEMNGLPPPIVAEALLWGGSGDDLSRLGQWIVALPKPCGIFAANDILAQKVVLACRASGVSVPDEVAVIGVDNLASLCENQTPTISSVRTDNERAGSLATDWLRELMKAPTRKGGCRTYGVRGLCRRESTRRFPNMDPRVRKALEFIRLHACEGITPRDVFAAMGCSQSLANLRFRQHLKHSILDEIHSVRLEKAKELLVCRDVDLTALPDFCGYASLSDLRRVFRQRVGCTMGDFRHQQRT